MDCNDRMSGNRMMGGRMSYSREPMGMMPGRDRRFNNGCDRGNTPVDSMNPGMSYVPWQKWEEVYDMERGFNCGTIFPSLNKPFMGRGGR